MKRKDDSKKFTGKVMRSLAKGAAFLEVNSTCPFTLYQDKLPDSVNQLRKK